MVNGRVQEEEEKEEEEESKLLSVLMERYVLSPSPPSPFNSIVLQIYCLKGLLCSLLILHIFLIAIYKVEEDKMAVGVQVGYSEPLVTETSLTQSDDDEAFAFASTITS